MKKEEKIAQLAKIEKEYNEKLLIASKNENYNAIQNLFWELKTLRKFYK
jgi:hypothetical protein